MKSFSHRNIVKLYTSFMSDDESTLFTVMEICEMDLQNFIRERNHVPLPYEIVIDWCCQLLCGLKYLHDKTVIHRDIKPAVLFSIQIIEKLNNYQLPMIHRIFLSKEMF